jgi:hypothetical protein
MTKLFLHNPIFRFLSPIFSGVVAYLLILLVNNNIEQLQEQFLGQELYVCITLAYVVHEFSRLLIWLFKYLPRVASTTFNLFVHMLIATVLCVVFVTILMRTYYQIASGYLPSTDELMVFNGIYIWISVSYVLLNISHQYLFKVNTQKLENEILIKQNIEEEFKQFKREINPDLLFESFEVLLGLIKEKTNSVDEFIDHLSVIYRYILSSKKNQLISVQEEKEIAKELITLYNQLPYRKVTLQVSLENDFLIVPGSLLFVVERIIKTTISSTKTNLIINITHTDSELVFDYIKDDRIIEEFNYKTIEDIINVYSIYSLNKININENEQQRIISIPMLEIKS